MTYLATRLSALVTASVMFMLSQAAARLHRPWSKVKSSSIKSSALRQSTLLMPLIISKKDER